MKYRIPECKVAAARLRLARLVLLAVALGMCATAVSAKTNASNGIPAAARPDVVLAVEKAAKRPHPRLFADADGFAALKARMGKEGLLTAGAEFIRATANPILKAKPCAGRWTSVRSRTTESRPWE